MFTLSRRMPVPSGLKRPADAPLEPAEEIWADTVSNILGDPEALDRYARAGRRRAGDFELSKTAELWRKLLGDQDKGQRNPQ